MPRRERFGPPHVRTVLAACSAVLVICVLCAVAVSRRWPLVGDAPLFHYVVFLMQHGMAPYRQIHDINLPGTYAVEAAVMWAMGGGALAWRTWDLLLLCFVAGSMYMLCRPHRFAALFAGATFALIHVRDGLIDLGQRDLLLTGLVLGAYVCVFRNIRHAPPRLWATLGFGVLLGAAATVKPPALLLLPALLPWLAAPSREKQQRFRWHVLSALAGACLPLLGVFFFLEHWHAWGAFTRIMVHLVPLHAAVLRLSWGRLLVKSVSSVMLPLFLLWLPVLAARRSWRNRESAMLLVGFGFGVVSFCMQGRGYPYHRYPSEAFLLLLIGLDLSWALRSQRVWLRACAFAGLAFASLVLAPRSLLAASRFDATSNQFDSSLEEALRKQRVPALQGQVQCFDMAGGCVTTLYRMHLVQSTGYLYDCYLFLPVDSPEAKADQEAYRKGFLQALMTRRPRLLIVTSDECGMGPPDFAYRKLEAWPALSAWIARNYLLAAAWVPARKEGWEGRPVLPYGYRLYRAGAPR